MKNRRVIHPKKSGFTLISKACQGGFTLIELLVVLFIIGALTGLLLPNLMGARERARDARRKQDLVEIKNALRLYYNDNQGYPADLSSLGDSHMIEVPKDPKNDSSYFYCVTADGEKFLLATELENPGDRDISDSKTLCPTSLICSPSPYCATINCYHLCAN